MSVSSQLPRVSECLSHHLLPGSLETEMLALNLVPFECQADALPLSYSILLKEQNRHPLVFPLCLRSAL